MPDIHLRFHRDMLVLSAPLSYQLAREGYDAAEGIELLVLTEDEAVEQALRLQASAGAQCLVTPTWGITGARLAHQRLRDAQDEAAAAALAMARQFTPQHLIAEIGPTGLPLDPNSAPSMKANRDQYAAAVRAFGPTNVDAFLLSGFTDLADLRCALMGVRKVCATPIMASVECGASGTLSRGGDVEEAAAVMADLEADVAGFSTQAAPEDAAALARRMAAACDLPLFAQLIAAPPAPRQREATAENPYWHADTMLDAAARLRAAGVQFLRAAGAATATYTGALVAATAGLDALR